MAKTKRFETLGKVTVKRLKRVLSKFPDDAIVEPYEPLCFSYGEGSGLNVYEVIEVGTAKKDGKYRHIGWIEVPPHNVLGYAKAVR